jgi:hypothetical protein
MLGGQDQQVLHKFQRRCKRVYIGYWCLLMFTGWPIGFSDWFWDVFGIQNLQELERSEAEPDTILRNAASWMQETWSSLPSKTWKSVSSLVSRML